LFLDEFLSTDTLWTPAPTAFDTTRAEELYGRMFFEYGDDSVAQLGGVHLACEGGLEHPDEVLEWGRWPPISSSRRGTFRTTTSSTAAFRYHVPRELDGDLRSRYVGRSTRCSRPIASCCPSAPSISRLGSPRNAQTSDAAYRMRYSATGVARHAKQQVPSALPVRDPNVRRRGRRQQPAQRVERLARMLMRYAASDVLRVLGEPSREMLAQDRQTARDRSRTCASSVPT